MEAHTHSIPHGSGRTTTRPRLGLPRRAQQHVRDAQGTGAIADTLANPQVERRDRFYRRSLALADAGAVAVGVVAATWLVSANSPTAASLLLIPLVVGVAKLYGLYDRDELVIHKTTMDQAPQLFQLATLVTLLFRIFASGLTTGPVHATHLMTLWGTLFVSLLLARWTARTLVTSVTPEERCLVIGDASSYSRLEAKLAAEGVPAKLVGRMSLQRLTRGLDPEERELDTWTLRHLIDDLQVHRLIIVPAQRDPGTSLELVRSAKATGVRVSLLPRVLEVVGTTVEFDELSGMTLLGVRRFGLSRSSALVKRSFDLVAAAAAVVLAAPLLALIAIAIKLDSRGPVFFRQERVGRNGQRFGIYKFRTMVTGADAMKADLQAQNETDGLFKITDDPRVTRVGRFLRSTSLDELPQILNVLRGEMSVVGPRPLIVDEDQKITGLDRRRLDLTPGMTGHWQILGSARVPLAEMVKIDYLYVAGWSLWADLKIIARTVPYVLSRRSC